MTTTGCGLGWPPQDSTSGGNWSGNWPDVGVGWPARPSRAGRAAFAVAGSAAAWHPPPGAGPTTSVGAGSAFPDAITEVRPFGGISAFAGQAASAGPVRGYARPVFVGTGNGASSAVPERTARWRLPSQVRRRRRALTRSLEQRPLQRRPWWSGGRRRNIPGTCWRRSPVRCRLRRSVRSPSPTRPRIRLEREVTGESPGVQVCLPIRKTSRLSVSGG